jgi:hypothetical protein
MSSVPKAEWNKFYKVINVDQATIDTLDKLRTEVRDALNALPVDTRNPQLQEGWHLTSQHDSEAQGKRLFQELGKYGIFVVDVGEPEGWLASLELNKSRGKGDWIVKAFEKLGSGPSAQSYVPPGKTDVWAFMDSVGGWINDPERQGLPETEAS